MKAPGEQLYDFRDPLIYSGMAAVTQTLAPTKNLAFEFSINSFVGLVAPLDGPLVPDLLDR